MNPNPDLQSNEFIAVLGANNLKHSLTVSEGASVIPKKESGDGRGLPP